MAPDEKITARPAYDPALFVGHSTESIGRYGLVQLMLEKAEQLCRNEPIEQRVTVFSGESAIGKTWLLQHIEHELHRGPCPEQMRIYRLAIPERAITDDGFEAVVEVRRVLEDFAQQVWSEEIHEVSLPELSRKVMEITEDRLASHCLTLFADGVFEADWNFLELLEEHLLGPLAIQPRVLIVLSGRSRKFPWATPELRFKADFQEINPFNSTETEAQVARLGFSDSISPSELETVQKIGQGVPGATYFLVQGGDFSKSQKLETLDTILTHYLASVRADERRKIRNYIEAICVLQAFDDDRVSTLVGVYERSTGIAPAGQIVPYEVSVHIQKLLVQEALAHYQQEEGAYKLDQYIAKLAEEYLRRKNPTLWRLLHETALNLYTEWSDKFPRTRNRWAAEATYHAQCLGVA